MPWCGRSVLGQGVAPSFRAGCWGVRTGGPVPLPPPPHFFLLLVLFGLLAGGQVARTSPAATFTVTVRPVGGRRGPDVGTKAKAPLAPSAPLDGRGSVLSARSRLNFSLRCEESENK